VSDSPHSKHQRLGGKLGPRIADITSKAMSDNLRRSADYRVKLHAEGLNEFFRGVGREKRQHVSPLLDLYLGGENTPPEVERILRFMHSGQGEASEMLSMLGVGQAVGTSILAALQNYLAPINQKLIELVPNALLDAGTMASADVRGLVSEAFAHGDAAKAGIDSPRFNVLRELAQQFPGLPELLTLWRRGLIDETYVRGALHRQGFTTTGIDYLTRLRTEILGPADMALGVLRGHVGQAEGEAVAHAAGIDAHDFNILVENTGEPPGLMQLLEAYRRGFINTQRLERGIRQSRVRNEWIDVVEKLRYEPASTSDAARAVVQNHISDAEGKQIAEWNGLRPEDWPWLIKTVGNPPGPMEMLSLLNRGEVSQAGVEQSLRESHIKDEYIPHILQLRVKIPPAFQISRMVTNGAMSHTRAFDLLEKSGYEKDVADSLVKSAAAGQTTKVKVEGAATITGLYHDRALTRADALKHLEALGYHANSANLMLDVTDTKRNATLLDAAIAPVKAGYIGHHIDQAGATADLDALKVPRAQSAYLLELWTVDRAAHRRSLTEAQIVKYNEMGGFTDAVALTRLENLGYTPEDARVILDSEKGRKTFV
jgi:hypothetical protein